jgi:hypothetical protein
MLLHTNPLSREDPATSATPGEANDEDRTPQRRRLHVLTLTGSLDRNTAAQAQHALLNALAEHPTPSSMTWHE